MAEHVLVLTLKVNGSASNADATPTLRDPNNAWGIRRVSTGEVVVASGTAMEAVSTGVYRYTATVTAGEVYQYAIRAIKNGQELFKVDTFVATADLGTSESAIDVTVDPAGASVIDWEREYDECASYDVSGSVAMAKRFVVACRVLLRRLPEEAASGSQRERLNLTLLAKQLETAQEFVAAHDTSESGARPTRTTVASFRNFR